MPLLKETFELTKKVLERIAHLPNNEILSILEDILNLEEGMVIQNGYSCSHGKYFLDTNGLYYKADGGKLHLILKAYNKHPLDDNIKINPPNDKFVVNFTNPDYDISFEQLYSQEELLNIYWQHTDKTELFNKLKELESIKH